MPRDNLDFLLQRPKSPLEELLGQLPEVPEDEDKLLEAKKQAFESLYPGVQPRDPAMLDAPGMEDIALKQMADERRQAAMDQQAAIEAEKRKGENLRKLAAARNQKFEAAGMAPPANLSSPVASPVSEEESIPEAPVAPPAETEEGVPYRFDKGQADAQKMNIQDLLKGVYGQGLGDEDIKAAQGDRSRNQLIATMLGAGDTIASGLSKGAYAGTPDIGKNILTMGDQGVKNINERREGKLHELGYGKTQLGLADDLEKRDPGSKRSEQYRQLVRSMGDAMGVKIDVEGLSEAQLESRLSPIERLMVAKQSADTKKETNKAKTDAATEKEIKKTGLLMKKDLDFSRAGSRTGLGKTYNIIKSADRLNVLMKDPAGKFKNLTDTEMVELARGLDTMLSGSQATVSITHELIPQTAWGNGMKIWQWVTNNPTGKDQMDFIKRYHTLITREKAVAKNEARNVARQQLSPYKWMKNTPEGAEMYNDNVKNAEALLGMPLEDDDEVTGTTVQEAPIAPPKAPGKTKTAPPSTTGGMVYLYNPQGVKFPHAISKAEAEQVIKAHPDFSMRDS